MAELFSLEPWHHIDIHRNFVSQKNIERMQIFKKTLLVELQQKHYFFDKLDRSEIVYLYEFRAG